MSINLGVPYRSALQNNARPSGRALRTFPLPPQAPIQLAAYLLNQIFQMRLDGNFPPAPKNTPANAAAFNAVAGSALQDANAILTAYTQPADNGAGLGTFSAMFSRVPASWDDFTENFCYTFPGFHGNLNTTSGGSTTISGRFDQPLTVTSRLRYDYFVVDPDNLAAAVLDSAGDAIVRVADASLIPVIQKTKYVGLLNPTFSDGKLTDAGGTSEGSVLWMETKPNKELYEAWIANALADKWASTVYDGSQTDPATTTDGQIVAEDSRNIVLAGNIIARVTRYVLAQ